MKKQYANPTVKVVFIEDADIVTQSDVTLNSDTLDGGTAQAKQRNTNIWDE